MQRKLRQSECQEVRAVLTLSLYERIKAEIKAKTYHVHSERRFFGMLLDTFLTSLLSLSPEQRTLCYSMLMENPGGFADAVAQVLRSKVAQTMAAVGK